MAEINVKDFRLGLDLRKFRLSLPAGSLLVGANGHINQGGEFEKRKAFVRLANSSGLVATSLPAGTFGWQAVAAGHLVFGSADGSALTFPAAVTYQRLQHPDGSTAMTSVIDSKLFGGKAWVIAKFADGNVFEYYNGSQILDFYSGLVWSGNNTNALITTSLQTLITATGRYTIQNIDTTDFYIFSIPSTIDSTPYTIANSITSNGGQITVTNISAGLPSTAAVAPVGQVQVVAGGSNTAASGTINSNNANPANGTTLTIGTTAYKFVNAFSGAANEILIQGTADGTSNALINAINNGTGQGVTYSNATTKSTQVTAGTLSAHIFTITAIVGGNAGNSLATTTTSSWTLSGATLSGGDVSNTNQITQIAVGATNLLSAAVQFNQSAAQTASDLSVAVNSNTATSGYSATAVAGVLTITPLAAGSSLNGTAITTTCAGNVCVDNCLFSISGLTANTTNISSITINGGANIMTATITYQDGGHPAETVAAFVARVAANINANSGTSGWLAYADGVSAKLNLSKKIRVSSDSTPAIVLTYNSATISVPSGTTYTITVSLSVKTLTVKYTIVTGVSPLGSTGSVTAVGSGGLAPYTFAWVFVSNSIQSTPLMYATKPAGATTDFKTTARGDNLKGSWSEVWKCVVTDSNNNQSDVDAVTIYSNPIL